MKYQIMTIGGVPPLINHGLSPSIANPKVQPRLRPSWPKQKEPPPRTNKKPWTRLTIRMERKDLVARKSRSMAMFRAAEPPLAKGASGKKRAS